jgi:uncharacterized protein (DUF1015 family)
MPEIAPFRGLLYNPERVEDLSAVLAPPYDVISPERRAALFGRHRYNITRIDLGHFPAAKDSRSYDEVADDLKRWVMDGVLVRDSRPAVYPLSQTFTLPGGATYTRRGVIGLVRLEGDRSGVLPHERTHAGPKADRLRLTQACGTQLSQVFGLAPDATGNLTSFLDGVCESPPVREATDPDGYAVRLWRVTEASLLMRPMAEALSGETLFIADGHHRYETALTYRQILRREVVDPEGTARPHDFVMMFICSMADPGLVVLPYHRMLRLGAARDRSLVLDRVGARFAVTDVAPDARAITEALAGARRQHAFALYGQGWDRAALAVLRDPVSNEAPEMHHLAAAQARIDVEVLHRILMASCLGIGPESLTIDETIGYSPHAAEVVEKVAAGRWDLGLLVNPTPVEHVRAVAEAGLTMPQKSTYFFPKLPTGLVLNPLEPTESVASVLD